jgi:hypothetical protein
MIDLVLDANPHDIGVIEYKNLTRERCMGAIRAGVPISTIPFALIDSHICVQAVKSNPEEFASVPLEFRDHELATVLMESHPQCLRYLPGDLITLDMIIRSISDSPSHLANLDYTGTHDSVRDLVVNHLNTLIDHEPWVVFFIPPDMVSDDHAIRAIELDKRIFWSIRGSRITDIDFVIRAVKKGVNINAIPSIRMTVNLLKELVRSRPGMIDEISRHFLSDTLYMEAIDAHDYDYTKIHPQYMTTDLCNFIAERKPDSNQARNLDVARIEFELEQSLIDGSS